MTIAPSVVVTSLLEVEQFARESGFSITLVGRKETKRFFSLHQRRERLRLIISDENAFNKLGRNLVQDMLTRFGEVEVWKNLACDLELNSKFLPPGVRSD